MRVEHWNVGAGVHVFVETLCFFIPCLLNCCVSFCFSDQLLLRKSDLRNSKTIFTHIGQIITSRPRLNTIL